MDNKIIHWAIKYIDTTVSKATTGQLVYIYIYVCHSHIDTSQHYSASPHYTHIHTLHSHTYITYTCTNHHITLTYTHHHITHTYTHYHIILTYTHNNTTPHPVCNTNSPSLILAWLSSRSKSKPSSLRASSKETVVIARVGESTSPPVASGESLRIIWYSELGRLTSVGSFLRGLILPPDGDESPENSAIVLSVRLQIHY